MSGAIPQLPVYPFTLSHTFNEISVGKTRLTTASLSNPVDILEVSIPKFYVYVSFIFRYIYIYDS
jgi:hypothetical protein